MITGPLHEFIDRVIDHGAMRDEDVARLRCEICPDGIASRSEADALIALDRLVDVPASWGDFMVQALLAFAQRQCAATGILTHDFINWLNSSLDIGQPTERAARIAAAVIAETHCVDDYLRRLAKMSFTSTALAEVRSAA